MEKEIQNAVALNDHLGCFGNFSPEDPICRKYCALNLRCAIESDRKEQMEILEDLASLGDFYVKNH
jgi:hypothetical protein